MCTCKMAVADNRLTMVLHCAKLTSACNSMISFTASLTPFIFHILVTLAHVVSEVVRHMPFIYLNISRIGHLE